MYDSTSEQPSLSLFEETTSTIRRRRPIIEANFPEYRSWKGCRNRCNNPNNAGYSNYGGRGIAVCERWSVFENFLEDMGKRPSPQHSLDRIDVNGPYSPENCRWATTSEQLNNTRVNHNLEFRGEVRTLAQWARLLGICKETLEWRIANNWTIESALTLPTQPKGATGQRRVGERNE